MLNTLKISVFFLFLVVGTNRVYTTVNAEAKDDASQVSLLTYDFDESNYGIWPNINGSSINSATEDDNGTRINGGEAVSQIVPYQISMQAYRRGQWRHFCGGSIITPYHIITAAHCVNRLKPEEIRIVSGTLTWKEGGDRHRVTAIRIHQNFSMEPKIINDIAIAKVIPPFNLYKNSISTISLGGLSRVGAKVSVRLTGWGSITPTASEGLPEKLQMLNYHTITNEECTRKGFTVTRNEVCVLAKKGQGACVGDSGGPLVATLQNVPQLIGIVSYGTATCAQGRPDVYTRVSSFLPYINKVITSEIP